MLWTFGLVDSAMLIHESWVGGYLSILQALSCPSVLRCYAVYLSSRPRWRGKSGACFHLKWLLCSSSICICLFWRHGVNGEVRRGRRVALKSDKLLKIAFTQSFLFGHTWHIWLWSGNKSAVAEGSALRVVPHIIPSSAATSSSSGLVWKHTDVHPALSFSPSLLGTRSWWCCVVMLGSCPIRAFLSSPTLRLSVGCNWGVCKDEDECSTVTLQAAHSFKGESCSQSGNFKHSQ